MQGDYQPGSPLKHRGAFLNPLFQKAFNVAKEVRSATKIQTGNISVASVVVDLAEKVFDSLEGLDVLLIGAGDTGRKAAKALLSRGARRIVVANRSLARGKQLSSPAISSDRPSRSGNGRASWLPWISSLAAHQHQAMSSKARPSKPSDVSGRRKRSDSEKPSRSSRGSPQERTGGCAACSGRRVASGHRSNVINSKRRTTAWDSHHCD